MNPLSQSKVHMCELLFGTVHLSVLTFQVKSPDNAKRSHFAMTAQEKEARSNLLR